jgi:hypothetical protein
MSRSLTGKTFDRNLSMSRPCASNTGQNPARTEKITRARFSSGLVVLDVEYDPKRWLSADVQPFLKDIQNFLKPRQISVDTGLETYVVYENEPRDMFCRAAIAWRIDFFDFVFAYHG